MWGQSKRKSNNREVPSLFVVLGQTLGTYRYHWDRLPGRGGLLAHPESHSGSRLAMCFLVLFFSHLEIRTQPSDSAGPWISLTPPPH